MQTALITGSGKRIGKELAVYLHSKGYKVILHYHHSREEAEKLAQELGCQVAFGNLAHTDAARFVFDQIKGEVDILINNAAHFKNDSLADFTYDGFLKTIMVNLHAPIALSREMINRNKSGVIINLLDAWVRDETTKFLSYAISKNTLEQFTRTAAAQLPEGFRMNGLLLGVILIKEGQNLEVFKKLQNKYPGTLEDICKAVEYVITNTKLNGQILDLTNEGKLT